MSPRTHPRASTLLIALALAGTLSACASSGMERAQRPYQSLELQVGHRSYGDLEPVEDQTTVGLEYVMERPGDAFGWGIGVAYGSQEGSTSGGTEDVEADVYELHLGLRRTFDTSTAVRPYLGVGLALIDVDASIEGPSGSSSDDDLTQGFYLRGGVRADLSRTLYLSFDARRVFGTDLDIDDRGWDADHDQLAFVLGWCF